MKSEHPFSGFAETCELDRLRLGDHHPCLGDRPALAYWAVSLIPLAR
jgi:hypothetical protein